MEENQESGQIGEAEATQPTHSTVAMERMALIISNNEIVIEDCKKIQALLAADPSLDDSFCRLFGLKADQKLEAYKK